MWKDDIIKALAAIIIKDAGIARTESYHEDSRCQMSCIKFSPAIYWEVVTKGSSA